MAQESEQIGGVDMVKLVVRGQLRAKVHCESTEEITLAAQSKQFVDKRDLLQLAFLFLPQRQLFVISVFIRYRGPLLPTQ